MAGGTSVAGGREGVLVVLVGGTDAFSFLNIGEKHTGKLSLLTISGEAGEGAAGARGATVVGGMDVVGGIELVIGSSTFQGGIDGGGIGNKFDGVGKVPVPGASGGGPLAVVF